MRKQLSEYRVVKGKYIFFISIAILLFVFILFLVMNNKKPENTAKNNLKNVIEAVLVFPDRSADKFYSSFNENNSIKVDNNNISPIGEDIREVISPYFTKKGANAMVSHWYTFGFFCGGTDWKTKVERLEIISDSKDNRMLSFTAVILCYKPNKKNQKLIVTGRAQYDETGLLNYWNLSGDSVNEIIKLNEQFQIDGDL